MNACVYEAGLSGLLSRISTNMDSTSPYYIGTLFDTFWDDTVKADVTAAFASAEQYFSNSFSNLTNPLTPAAAAPAGSDALHQDKVSSANSSNSTQTNFGMSHVKMYGGNGGTFPASPDGTSHSGLANAYQNNKGAVDLNDLMSTLQGIFTDPKAFADVVMYEVIKGMQTAAIGVLDVIEDLMNALIAAISDAFNTFQGILTKQIDIPVISWLYKQISGGDPLTILDLMCLLMAIPTTLLYKLTFGMPNATAPFSAQDVTNAVAMFGPGNFPWPPEAGGGRNDYSRR
ncbi:hypothetical protein [Granulicella sp. L56]|uniref:hypothetical protein n=1 Tax=Granulicella sp. L56 TaxID=1747222 RepID=UPI00131D5C26|nr:hypothetical protein [Granulicella sp. L56]